MEFYFWLSSCKCSCSLPEHCFTASVGNTWHADSMEPLPILSECGCSSFPPRSAVVCTQFIILSLLPNRLTPTISNSHHVVSHRAGLLTCLLLLATMFIASDIHPFPGVQFFDTKFHIFSSLIKHRFGIVAFNQSSLYNFCLSEIPPNSLERVPFSSFQVQWWF